MTPEAAKTQTNRPYGGVRSEDLILRDVLAADRTVLANERTMLAYIRTAFACLAGGAGLLHFFDSGFTLAAGWVMIALAFLILGFGTRRFLQVRRDLLPLLHAKRAASKFGADV